MKEKKTERSPTHVGYLHTGEEIRRQAPPQERQRVADAAAELRGLVASGSVLDNISRTRTLLSKLRLRTPVKHKRTPEFSEKVFSALRTAEMESNSRHESPTRTRRLLDRLRRELSSGRCQPKVGGIAGALEWSPRVGLGARGERRRVFLSELLQKHVDKEGNIPVSVFRRVLAGEGVNPRAVEHSIITLDPEKTGSISEERLLQDTRVHLHLLSPRSMHPTTYLCVPPVVPLVKETKSVKSDIRVLHPCTPPPKVLENMTPSQPIRVPHPSSAPTERVKKEEGRRISSCRGTFITRDAHLRSLHGSGDIFSWGREGSSPTDRGGIRTYGEKPGRRGSTPSRTAVVNRHSGQVDPHCWLGFA